MTWLKFFCCALLLASTCNPLQAQDDSLHAQELAAQKDISDVARSILKKEPKKQKEEAASIALLPVLGYNPSFGFNIGINIMAGKQFGHRSNTIYSVFNVSFSYSTKQIAPLRARHNMFTAGNKWNWQGDWQLAKMGIVDYGVGTGQGKKIQDAFSFYGLPTLNKDSAYPIKYKYLKLFEKAYRKVGKYWYVGGGVSFDIYSRINDVRLDDRLTTPHKIYSKRNDFDTAGYASNGFLFALQYNSREHPIKSYSGIYADVNLRINPTWMGSSRSSAQLIYDFREYISLDKSHKDHVLALWQWGSYKLSGAIPYLEMPGTAHDTYQRSGRAYTFGRFKGPSYACFEGEYRFPILPNRFLSGVCFINYQTASNDYSRKIFEYGELGAGAGVRILFNKNSRSALCLDFAKGRNGASGVFCGLNEVF
jgi:outer membrane protein assembly factor BamA